MGISFNIQDIMDKALDGYFLARGEIVRLLETPPHSMDAGMIMAVANTITWAASKGIADERNFAPKTIEK